MNPVSAGRGLCAAGGPPESVNTRVLLSAVWRGAYHWSLTGSRSRERRQENEPYGERHPLYMSQPDECQQGSESCNLAIAGALKGFTLDINAMAQGRCIWLADTKSSSHHSSAYIAVLRGTHCGREDSKSRSSPARVMTNIRHLGPRAAWSASRASCLPHAHS